MKALVWEAARSMALREEREPVAPADEILVKVRTRGYLRFGIERVSGA